MPSINSPTRRDVDIFLETLEEEERMRQKQAALAYARYRAQRQTYQVTGRDLARLFWRLLLAAAVVGLLVWLDS